MRTLLIKRYQANAPASRLVEDVCLNKKTNTYENKSINIYLCFYCFSDIEHLAILQIPTLSPGTRKYKPRRPF